MEKEHRTELLNAVGLHEASTDEVKEFLREVQVHIEDVKTEFAGQQQELVRLFNVTAQGCEMTVGGLRGLLEISDHVFADSLSPDDASGTRDLIDRVSRLLEACDSRRTWLRANSQKPFIETAEAMASLTRRLLPVFDRNYTRQKSGRGATLKRDRTDFIRVSMSAAGIQHPPGDDHLHQAYIVPARQLLGEILEGRVKAAAEDFQD
jgi:hypothetical protein